MKRSFIKAALLCILVTTTFVACEKENVENSNAPQEQTQEQSIVLFYEIDGIAYQQAFNTQEEYESYLSYLLTITRQGHRVRVYRSDINTIAAKDVVRFETKDRAEYEAWEKEMLLKGYAVETIYNKDTDTWSGTAYKQ